MTKAINIAIIGSHKVGKTSVFEEILKGGLPPDHNIEFFNEIAQEKISEADTFFKYMAMQEDILTYQIKVLKWAKENKVSTLSDRSLIDNLAYMNVGRYSPYSYALSGDAKSSRDILKDLSPVVTEAIAHFYDYDLIIYIPIEFKLGNPTKEQISYQESVDGVIKRLLEIYGIKHYTIKGSVEERKILAMEKIKQYMGGE